VKARQSFPNGSIVATSEKRENGKLFRPAHVSSSRAARRSEHPQDHADMELIATARFKKAMDPRRSGRRPHQRSKIGRAGARPRRSSASDISTPLLENALIKQSSMWCSAPPAVCAGDTNGSIPARGDASTCQVQSEGVSSSAGAFGKRAIYLLSSFIGIPANTPTALRTKPDLRASR